MNSILETLGNTPLIRLNNINKDIYLKIEKNNPTGSVKDRPVYYMIENLEKQGLINKNTTLTVSTSGNTGISLSMIGTMKGYEVVIIMPENMSKERQLIMKAYGAKLILTDKALGMQGALDKENELIKSNPSYISIKQFEDKYNVLSHYETTAEEIIKDLKNIDIFVTGVGTGGTISGVGKRLKEFNSNIKIIAIEPAASPMISKGKKGPHMIQGIGAGFIPKILNINIIDEVITIENGEAFEGIGLLGRKEGILAGISTGANLMGALKVADKYPNKNIVTIACDGFEKYLSLNIL